MILPQEKFMQAAIDAALLARSKGDYAFGAVVVRGDEIIARGINRVKIDLDASQHAEMVAIRGASKAIGHRYLEGCVLYTTHEPCPMCTATAVWANMTGIVSGAKMEDISEYRFKNGNGIWKWRTIDIPAREVAAKGDPQIEVVEEFMRKECLDLFHAE